MTSEMPFLKILKAAIIVSSLILWVCFVWILITSLPSLGSLPEFLIDCMIVSIQNGTILLILALICASVYYWMYSMNFEFSLRINGVASVLYIFLILILLFGGMQMIAMASSSASPSNITDSNALQKQAKDTLGSGIFGNGIGLIGIALAVFGLLLTTFDKIESSKTFRTWVTLYQIENLALCWFITSLFIDIGLVIQFERILNFLPNLYPITLMICGLLIEIIGLLLLGVGYIQYKDEQQDSFSDTIKRAVMDLSRK